MWGKRKLFLVACLLGSLVYATPATAALRPTGKLVPADGALFGAFADMGTSGWNQHEVAEFEAMIGRTLDIDHRYYAWNDPFPGENESWDAVNGRIPLITWEPWDAKLNAIRAGVYDAMVRQRAAALRDGGSPVFLRFAHEMNGNWYPWDGYHNNGSGKRNGPAIYVAAWRHLHRLFTEEGATNVVWVWCPNQRSFPSTAWNNFRNYYPGDAYVDWVCVDGYNFGTSASTSWRSFAEVLRPIYRAYGSIKPIMVAETGSVELGGDKAQWIADAADALRQEFPSVAAFLWFNMDKNGFDRRVNSSEAALEAFRRLAADPYFNVGGGVSAQETPPAPDIVGDAVLRSPLLALTDDPSSTETTAPVQWQRCDWSGATCRPIANATGSVYEPTDADVGARVRVAMTVPTDAGTVMRVSNPTPRIARRYLRVGLWARSIAHRRRALIGFKLSRGAVVRVTIENLNGKVVRHRRSFTRRSADHIRLRWYGRNDAGVRVRRGEYVVVVTAQPLQSERRAVERRKHIVLN